jgi:hypothetical protein
MLNWIRARWRAIFQPEPRPRLDGVIIQMRALSACNQDPTLSFTDAYNQEVKLRGEENHQRDLAWKRGESIKGAQSWTFSF